jgi:hypothetical protein
MATPERMTRIGNVVVDVVLIVGFLGLAAWFLRGSPPVEIPPAVSPAIPARAISPAPVRNAQFGTPVVTIGGFERPCMDCHRLFESREETPRRLTQHRDIVLDHGLNDRCFNCHDREDRNRLALRGGRTVAYSNVPRLCAKCHGPTYRDWQLGMHGKSLGQWNPRSPGQRRLQCSECHDPHAPAFAPMRPLPGPNTLRMGEPVDKEHGPTDMMDPLRKWRHEEEQSRSPAPPKQPDDPEPAEGYDKPLPDDHRDAGAQGE